jgi:succinoglycan biosynthesis transport protein ExoP
MAFSQDAIPALGRVVPRSVPTSLQYYAPERVGGVAAPAEEQSFLETLRKLWRHRLLIAACTLVLGGAAILAAWLMPSYCRARACPTSNRSSPKSVLTPSGCRTKASSCSRATLPSW